MHIYLTKQINLYILIGCNYHTPYLDKAWLICPFYNNLTCFQLICSEMILVAYKLNKFIASGELCPWLQRSTTRFSHPSERSRSIPAYNWSQNYNQYTQSELEQEMWYPNTARTDLHSHNWYVQYCWLGTKAEQGKCNAYMQ